ncbi:MAG: hypothetical protein P9L94_18995 [Candidatus Hinthialibacter antarcticus]|nr:hypothetical protein [Candidatus Hinthialibacter antarcticus]
MDLFYTEPTEAAWLLRNQSSASATISAPSVFAVRMQPDPRSPTPMPPMRTA